MTAPVTVTFESPNAVQLDRIAIPFRSQAASALGRALPFMLVALLATTIAAIAARQGVSLRGSFCLFLGLAPFIYAGGKLGGLLLKMFDVFGQVRAGAQRPFHNLSIGAGRSVRVTVGPMLKVLVDTTTHEFDWRIVSLVFTRTATVFTLEGGRHVGVPDAAFATQAEKDAFVGAARAHVSTFFDLRNAGDDLRKLYDKDQ